MVGILNCLGGEESNPINDRDYIKCTSDYCQRFNGPNNVPLDKGRIIETDSVCKKCDCNGGQVNMFYSQVSA